MGCTPCRSCPLAGLPGSRSRTRARSTKRRPTGPPLPGQQREEESGERAVKGRRKAVREQKKEQKDGKDGERSRRGSVGGRGTDKEKAVRGQRLKTAKRTESDQPITLEPNCVHTGANRVRVCVCVCCVCVSCMCVRVCCCVRAGRALGLSWLTAAVLVGTIHRDCSCKPFAFTHCRSSLVGKPR